MNRLKNILWIAGAILALSSCSHKYADASKPTPKAPAYNPFYGDGVLTAPIFRSLTPADLPAVIVSDSVLPEGSHLVTIRLTGEIKVNISGGVSPPRDTAVLPPVSSSIDGIGVNAFPWTPLDKLSFFSTVRCYIASGWIWRPGGLYAQPMFQGETAQAHGLDDYFTDAKNRGIDVLPCINQTPEWFRQSGNGTGSNDFPFIKPGANRQDPKSWEPYAQMWYQFVCRYGSVVHSLSDLKVDTTARWSGDIRNVQKSGLGLIRAVEIGNEHDRWWDKGTEKYVTAAEQVAMLAAVINAIRKADPSMVIVMGGLTGFDLPYLRDMDAAFKKLGVKWPDIVNVHHYSHEGNLPGVWPPTWKNDGATYPELDKDFVTISAIVEFGKSIGRPVWVTEFGADTKGPSWMHIVGSKFGNITDEQAQAELITKTFKKYREAGVQRSYVFMAADEGGTGLWQTCGLMSSQATGYVPKPAYYEVQKLITTLKR